MQQGTSVTLNLSSRSADRCSSCLRISQLLDRYGYGIDERNFALHFKAFTRVNVRVLKAPVRDGVILCLEPDYLKQPGYLKAISPDYLSSEFSLRCLKTCMQHHQDTCGSPQSTLQTIGPASTYLIDLESKSLIRKNTLETYAALSYVWGESKSRREESMLRCTVTTLPQMQEPNFFSSRNTDIPQTIVQAMAFTKLMGLRYLWVDRFCIVQDDRWEKHNQLRSMGSIYLHAHFVIIATEGDGSFGLRKQNQAMFNLGMKRYIEGISNFEGYELDENEALPATMAIMYEPVTANTQWSTRGWTFQEQMFARRSFIFRGNIVTFQCQQGHRQEGTNVLISHEEELSLNTTRAIPKWPDLLYFGRMLREYTPRELTYPCDSLDAFEGVLNMLKTSFPGDILFGLPEVCFDIALLWQPRDMITDRVALAKAEGKPTANLPTWSWARWKGNFNLTAWEASAECLFQSYYSQNILRIKNIVQWQKRSTKGEIASVMDNYTQHRDLARSDTKELPVGWIQQAVPLGLGRGSSLSGLLQSTNHRFTHRSLGRQQSFRFPIPLPSDCTATAHDQQWVPELIGRVERAFLSIGSGRLTSKISGCWYPVQTRMKNDQLVQVGVIQVHDELFKTNGKCTGLEEFIAISAGEFLGVPGQSVGAPWDMLDDWELRQRTSNNNVYEFYNVMLIEQDDGIAKRRGLGRVQMDLWKASEKEEIEVVLG